MDFFEPLDAESKMLTARRLTAYTSGVIGEGKVLDMEAIREMSDDQIKELLSLGYVFRHKTYEERLSESGGVAQTYKFDWGEPKGRELF